MADKIEEFHNEFNDSNVKRIGRLDEKKAIIHTMPKRFLGIRPSSKKTKGIGALIMAVGAAFIVVGLAFLYFYLLDFDKVKQDMGVKEQPAVFVSEEDKTEKRINQKEEKTVPETFKESAGENDIKTKTIINDIATSSLVQETASTSLEMASGTKTIKAIKATSTADDFKSALDSDYDGLTDLEEFLLDCNPNSRDSDGDNYEDRQELFNLYNPAGKGSLMVNPNIEKYTNNVYNYTLYYPAVWTIEKIADGESIMFKADNNQFIQIIVQPNPQKQQIEEWYKEQFNVNAVKDEQKVYKKGWFGVKSQDGLTAYLACSGNDNIFTLTYNIGLGKILNYGSIFEVMVKSIEIKN